MTDAPTENILDRKSLVIFAVDILLSVLVGFLISVLIVIPAIVIAGADFSFFAVAQVVSRLFSSEAWGYSSDIGEALLIPIFSSGLTIAGTRHLINRVASCKSWLAVTIIVALTAGLLGIWSAHSVVSPMEWFFYVWLLVTYAPAIGLPIFFIGFLPLLSLGIIFNPNNRIAKIFMIALAASLVGGLLELVLLILVLSD